MLSHVNSVWHLKGKAYIVYVHMYAVMYLCTHTHTHTHTHTPEMSETLERFGPFRSSVSDISGTVAALKLALAVSRTTTLTTHTASFLETQWFAITVFLQYIDRLYTFVWLLRLYSHKNQTNYVQGAK